MVFNPIVPFYPGVEKTALAYFFFFLIEAS